MSDDEVVQRLRLLPFDFAARWCEPGALGCACMGCANGSEIGSGALAFYGVTKEQWQRAMTRAFREFIA